MTFKLDCYPTTLKFDVRGTGETMLGAIASASLFYVSKEADGSFEITEANEAYYSAKLTKEQLIALANELLALAES